MVTWWKTFYDVVEVLVSYCYRIVFGKCQGYIKFIESSPWLYS